MKNKILLVLLFCFTSLFSQVSDIANLASGKLKKFTKVLNLDNSIYGYFVIYSLEDVSETEERFEYVLLDRNLNKVANGQFIDNTYKSFWGEFLYPQKLGDEIIISKVYKSYSTINKTKFPGKHGFTSHRVLSLKNNKLSNSFYYQDGKLIEGTRNIEDINKKTEKLKVYDYPVPFKDGFFLAEDVKYDLKYYKEMTSLKAFGHDRKEKWTYEYNPNKEQIGYVFQVLDEENVLLRVYNFKTKSIAFHSLDPKTGKLNFVYELENKKSDYNHLFYVKAFEDRYVILGKYAPQSRFGGYNQESAKGFYRIELDKSGKEISNKYLPWKELKSIIAIKNSGKLEDKNYRLSSKQFFAFKNGKVSIINEKRKEYTGMSGLVRVKTTDFVVLNFDKDFNPVSKSIVEKEKSKSLWVHTDYLFSQKINNENGVAFFYVDSKKQEDKNIEDKKVLGIVIIKDGKVTEEKIPVGNIKYIEKAREGYVLFREIDKEKGIDEIRLERLNF